MLIFITQSLELFSKQNLRKHGSAKIYIYFWTEQCNFFSKVILDFIKGSERISLLYMIPHPYRKKKKKKKKSPSSSSIPVIFSLQSLEVPRQRNKMSTVLLLCGLKQDMLHIYDRIMGYVTTFSEDFGLFVFSFFISNILIS